MDACNQVAQHLWQPADALLTVFMLVVSFFYYLLLRTASQKAGCSDSKVATVGS